MSEYTCNEKKTLLLTKKEYESLLKIIEIYQDQVAIHPTVARTLEDELCEKLAGKLQDKYKSD